MENISASSSRADAQSSIPTATALLNTYSCLPCRRKKRKCDRKFPCDNCQKVGMECLFVPRRPSTRQPVSVGLSQRIEHLERIISQLLAHGGNTAATASATSDRSSKALESPRHSDFTGSQVDELFEVGTGLGRLALEDGRSRYVSGHFWASLAEEVDDLKSILCSHSEDLDLSVANELNHSSACYPTFTGLFPGHQPCRLSHPPPEQVSVLWEYFKRNCDILIKVLHTPSMESNVLKITKSETCGNEALDALMMAIYFAAIVSLSPEQCMLLLGGEKPVILRRFKYAAEQALADAGLLVTDEIMVLQAFAIFLTTVRNYSNTRFIWTLTALLVRLAQNAGIHRDGLHFNLSPFDTEMRRRLWWNICVLDSRACEDTGYGSTIPPACFDTQLPMNINDSEITPLMTAYPSPKGGLTQNTFSVMRFEFTKLFRNIQDVSATSNGLENQTPVPQRFVDKANEIEEIQKRTYARYLKHLDLSDPFSWYMTTVCQIIFTKMRLITYHPYLRNGKVKDLPQDVQDALFKESTVAIEYWLLLNDEKSTQPWRWICETYEQWYPLAFVLSELCSRTEGEEVDRAWNAVDDAFRVGDKIHFLSCQENQVQWGVPICDPYKPLRKLLIKARLVRTMSKREFTANGDGHSDWNAARKVPQG